MHWLPFMCWVLAGLDRLDGYSSIVTCESFSQQISRAEHQVNAADQIAHEEINMSV